MYIKNTNIWKTFDKNKIIGGSKNVCYIKYIKISENYIDN